MSMNILYLLCVFITDDEHHRRQLKIFFQRSDSTYTKSRYGLELAICHNKKCQYLISQTRYCHEDFDSF